MKLYSVLCVGLLVASMLVGRLVAGYNCSQGCYSTTHYGVYEDGSICWNMDPQDAAILYLKFGNTDHTEESSTLQYHERLCEDCTPSECLNTGYDDPYNAEFSPYAECDEDYAGPFPRNECVYTE